MDDKHRLFYVVWCDTGLDVVYDATTGESQFLLDKISGADPKSSEFTRLVSYDSLRARFNSHRHYRSYLVRTSDLSKEDLIQLFDTDFELATSIISESGTNVRV